MGVDVYFNLHRKVWSIRCRKSGLVTDHARVVAFPLGASMVVRPAGRAKVQATGQKNVHAFVRGAEPELSDRVADWLAFGRGLPEATRITYNPRHAGHFTRKDNGARIDSASAIVMVAPPDAPPEVWAVPKNSA
ncbi:hypothetical protein [Phaeobacter phage MD18]|nr:hypothetical protein [Phaeobacter phage MD18]